jgi:hypothetical protein
MVSERSANRQERGLKSRPANEPTLPEKVLLVSCRPDYLSSQALWPTGRRAFSLWALDLELDDCVQMVQRNRSIWPLR